MRSILVLMILGFWSCSQDSGQQQKKTVEKTKKEIPTMTATSNKDASKTILFFGNSLTAAYGLEPAQGFVGLIEKRLDSLNLNYRVINAGLSGETTAGGNDRIDWILEHNPIDIFILELGGNDGLRGINVKQSFSNLHSIVKKVITKYPKARIIIAGMEAPPNMGQRFTTEFRAMFPKLAKEYNASLIPFLLEGVGGNPELNLPDGIHPNVKGHKIVTENIWKVLKPIL